MDNGDGVLESTTRVQRVSSLFAQTVRDQGEACAPPWPLCVVEGAWQGAHTMVMAVMAFR